MKLLVWLGLLLLIVLAVRSKVRGLRKDLNGDAQAGAQRPAAPPPVAMAENMVACARCGLYLPASEALLSDIGGEPQYFCCQEHLQATRAESA